MMIFSTIIWFSIRIIPTEIEIPISRKKLEEIYDKTEMLW